MNTFIKAVGQGVGIALVFSVGMIVGGRISQPMAHADQPAAAPEVIRAQKIELVDDKGAVRATFNIDKGQPRLVMLNSKQAVSFSAGISRDEQPYLAMLDDKAMRSMLTIGKTGGMLAFFDQEQQMVIMYPPKK